MEHHPGAIHMRPARSIADEQTPLVDPATRTYSPMGQFSAAVVAIQIHFAAGIND
jgi:hypothetical protein